MSEAAESLRQIIEGEDFSTPNDLLRSIKAATAVQIPPGCPYSIATNVKHALLWQDLWLAKLRGETPPKVVSGQDFPVVSEEEWPEVRKAFVEGFREAWEIAKGENDEAALKTLYKIGNHGAYHLGQVQLLKRILTGESE
jgi:hypothetical protein